MHHVIQGRNSTIVMIGGPDRLTAEGAMTPKRLEGVGCCGSRTSINIAQPTFSSFCYPSFFTTKTAGIGLGLAIVRRIIWEHGGDIACTSAEGQGTGFHIVLPVTDTSASRATPAQGGEDAHQGVSSR